ncbi:hypothetical protein BDV12DRAFT_156853 [Aspergillus spectabilis]
MTEDSSSSSLLTTLCSICHTEPPKYRCPRCSTRTCSLPCTRRHKLWSECSGIRDPAAYLRRNELTTESAFDRDFNFITGIERRIERAGREAENRGVDVAGRFVGFDPEEGKGEDGAGGKRKFANGKGGNTGGGIGTRPEAGLVKGEAGFLRRAQEAGVRVIKAPRGMSRAKMNGSKWHPRQKCLHWTIEWVTDNGNGKKRLNCAETCTLAEAFDRAFPLSREERQSRSQEITHENPAGETTQSEPAASETVAHSTSTTTAPPLPPTTEPPTTQEPTPAPESTENEIPSHRTLLFYIHRPRTTTKLPVLCPVSPTTTLTNALRNRTVLEFPTIYVIRNSLSDGDEQPGESKLKFILENEYLRTNPDIELEGEEAEEAEAQLAFEAGASTGAGVVDIAGVDEGKVLEVLEKDLLAVPEAEAL